MPGIHQRTSAHHAAAAAAHPEPLLATTCLADVLLKLWCVGRISATSAQMIAQAAMGDGLDNQAVAKIASCGAFGEISGNIGRDFRLRVCSDSKLSAIGKVTAPCIDTRTGRKETTQISHILPHKLLASMFESYNDQFHSALGTSDIKLFWDSVDMTDVRISYHQGIPTDKTELEMCIPLWIHGDAVQYQERNHNSLMCWSWGSLLTKETNSFMSAFLFACFPKSAATDETWHELMDIFAWSLGVCMTGKWPSRQRDGSPFAPNSLEAEKADTLLAGGFKLMPICLNGDLEHFALALGLPHYARNEFCWLCDCSKVGPTKKRHDYFLPDHERIAKDPDAELQNSTSDHVLFSVGMTVFNVMIDVLHTWDQGCWSHLAGSVLKELVYGRSTGNGSPAEKLSQVWQQITYYYRLMESRNRLANLTLGMIVHDVKSPNKVQPVLSAKAAETRDLIPVLAKVCEDISDGSLHAQHRLEAMKHAAAMQRVILEEPIVMSRAGKKALQDHTDSFLTHYSALRAWALESDFTAYHVVPKFHFTWHLPNQACFLNPAAVWTYKNEDWVGKVSTIAHSTSFGCHLKDLSHKVTEKYQFLIHFSFTKHFFSN